VASSALFAASRNCRAGPAPSAPHRSAPDPDRAAPAPTVPRQAAQLASTRRPTRPDRRCQHGAVVESVRNGSRRRGTAPIAADASWTCRRRTSVTTLRRPRLESTTTPPTTRACLTQLTVFVTAWVPVRRCHRNRLVDRLAGFCL
jgi:hypothetical protein